MRLNLLTIGCWLLAWGWIGPGPMTARADWLYFKQGGQAELPATVTSATVEVTTPSGPMVFPRSTFRAIVPGERWADQWSRRRLIAATDGSAAAWFAVAWWALEQGLTPEAMSAFRTAAEAPGASDHPAVVRSARMLDHLAAPVADPDLGAVVGLLGTPGWSRLEGRHVLLLHQGLVADASERLDVLDRVVATYYLSLAARGVELPVPRQRLLSVWFARQVDYVAALRRVEAAPYADTQGFYHPNFRVVFAFDTRSESAQAQPRTDLGRRRARPDLHPDQVAEIERQTLLLDLRWRSVDLGIAAHETVHQLVAASGLAPRFDDFPIWLHEGFAAQFEVVRGGRWAGFGRNNDLRLPDWRSIHPAPQLAPLLRDEGLKHGYSRDRYAESWALVSFLRRTRPTEFIAYLNLLQARPSPPSTQATFEAAFKADLGAMQAEWRRFLKDQTTPLEDHEPRPGFAQSW